MSIFKAAILYIQDRADDLAPQLRRLWRAHSEWKALEPSGLHVPFSRAHLMTWVVAAHLTGQFEFAALLLTGFCGLLRPGELLQLRRQHLVFPEESTADADILFCAIPWHETTNARSRDGSQHATIRDSLVIKYIRRVVRAHDPDDRVYRGTAYHLDKV